MVRFFFCWVYIKDGICLVNKISGKNKTCWDITESIFVVRIQSVNASSRINSVFNIYKDRAIKTAE